MNIIEKLGITKGEWIAGPKNGEYFHNVFGDDNIKVAETTRANHDVDHSNANLIAAAPEMLEALIEVYALQYNSDDGIVMKWVEDIIQKATGKTWAEIKELL